MSGRPDNIDDFFGTIALTQLPLPQLTNAEYASADDETPHPWRREAEALW